MMKVPLMASISKKTIDLRTGAQKVRMYINGQAEAVESPYKPYFYMEDREGDEKKTIASTESLNLT